jgi:hypothetical protein
MSKLPLAEQIKSAREKRLIKQGKLKVPKPPKQVKTAKVKVPSKKSQEPKTPTAPKKTPAPETSNSGEAVCSICHKPLSRSSSISARMGDVCQHKMSLLPQGVSLEEHYANLTDYEVPEGWIKVKDAASKAREKGYSVYRFVQAIGGDRMLRKPLNKFFQVKLIKGVRYIDGEVLRHIKDMEKVG